jgi:hypothetical protein
LQTSLERTASDVVIFLDACESAASISSSNIQDGGKTELIAACGFRETTLAEFKKRISFTCFLARAMIERGSYGNSFSIAKLHERVLAIIIRHENSDILGTPVYTCLNEKDGQRSIRLKVLDNRGIEESEGETRAGDLLDQLTVALTI